MANLLFRGPTWEEIKNPSPFYLHQLLTNPPRGFWAQGSGDATLEYEETSGDEISLLILPNDEFGIYLKYHRRKGGRIVETWLSLHDANRLNEVTTCSDEWLASVGLFLPVEVAAQAVEEFARSGRRSDAVRWITEAEIPETGNS